MKKILIALVMIAAVATACTEDEPVQVLDDQESRTLNEVQSTGGGENGGGGSCPTCGD